jgi:NAD(P)-dependent dehydrogenase (short-subunit alcohol dehydrogenase family)
MDLELSGKVALVTGAAYGIGRAIALRLAQEGASVAVHCHTSRDQAEQTAARVREHGVPATVVHADFARREEIDAAVERVTHDLGPVDVLVNNAAFVQRKRFPETSWDDWEAQAQVTAFGAMECTRAVLPSMTERGQGRVINITGESGKVGESGLVATSAIRASVIGFTRALAKEVGRFGVTVNGVSLGLIKTEGSERHMTPEWLEKNLDRILAQYPVRRLGTPEDVAPLVALLASPLGGYITGQVISVSGGYSTV